MYASGKDSTRYDLLAGRRVPESAFGASGVTAKRRRPRRRKVVISTITVKQQEASIERMRELLGVTR